MRFLCLLLISSFLLLTLSQCKNQEDLPALSCPLPALPFSSWEVTHFEESGMTTVPPQSYVLTSAEDNFSLTLDKNTCKGSLELCTETQTIKFLSGGCTYACCDSEFAQQMINFLFQEVDDFLITGRNWELRNTTNDKKLTLRATS